MSIIHKIYPFKVVSISLSSLISKCFPTPSPVFPPCHFVLPLIGKPLAMLPMACVGEDYVSHILEYPYGSEGRLYRTGDLSTDNLTAVGSSAGGLSGDWVDDNGSDSYADHDQTRVSVVKFQDEEEDADEGREVSTIAIIVFKIVILSSEFRL